MRSWIKRHADELAGMKFPQLVVLTVLIQEETIDRFLSFRDDPEVLRDEAATWNPFVVRWLARNLDLMGEALKKRSGDEMFEEVRRVLAAELATRGDDA